VVRNDIMVDKLILKDVQLTVANDDNYFVFEDVVLQVQIFIFDVIKGCFLQKSKITVNKWWGLGPIL